MKKRILGIFLALSMVLSTFTAFAYDDVVTTLEKTSVSLVEGLGIMSAKDGESFGSMEYMTRGDFALAVAKMLNYDVTEGKMGNSAFSDVDISTEQGCAVNLLADTGIIPTDSNKFEPTANIQYADAARMLLNSLGYEYEINMNGGYPGGVMKVAAQLKLSQGASSLGTNTVLTKRDAAIVIYNTLMSPVVNMTMDNGQSQYGQSDVTLLEDIWDVYEMTGVISGVGSMSLDGVALSDTQVSISGEVMETTLTTAADYFGYEVKAYYMDNDGDRTLVAIVPRSTSNTVTTIDIDDLVVSGNSVRYYTDDGKSKTQSVASDVQVLKNGRIYTDYSNFEDLFNFPEGNVTFIANDGSKRANVILINDVKHFFVERVDKKNTTLYLSNSSESEDSVPYLPSFYELDFDTQDITILKDGVEVGFDSIEANNVLTVTETPSQNDSSVIEDIKIVISTEIVEGTIESITANKEMRISGKEYDISAYSTVTFNSGDNGSFAVTSDGKIMGIVSTSGSSLKYAYVIYSSFDENEARGYVKLFTQDGEYKVFSTDEKVVVNGKKYMYNEFTSVIKAGEFITFRVNGDGYISNMNRPYDASSRPDHVSVTSFEKNWSKSSVRYVGGILGRSIVSDDTTIFYIPRYESDNPADYKLLSKDDLESRIYSDVSCYDVDRNGRIGALIIKEDVEDSVSESNSMFIVSEVNHSVNNDGDPVISVDGYEKGEAKTLIFDEDSRSITYEDGWMNKPGNEDFDEGYESLRPGDAFQYSIASGNTVAAYRKIYNNEKTIYNGGDLTYTDKKYFFERWSKTGSVTKIDFYDDLYIGFGNVEMRYNDYMVLCALNEEERNGYANALINMIDYYRPINLNQEETYIYTYNVSTDEVEIGSMDDISKNDIVFVRSKDMGELNEVIVYISD